MPSIINSDDGVVSGSSGLKTTGGNDGILALQNNGTTNVTVTAAGNVGVGTSSPTAPLDVNGNLAITGNARRITGDFTNATVANRVAFQSSTTNGVTDIPVIPNGTGVNARHFYYSSSDTANASLLTAGVIGAEATFRASAVGTGTAPPITFYTGGSERVRIDTSGNLQFNSGYGSVAVAYGCRAWVNFNGTGTVAIRASGNVSSITDNGTGDYTINFTTAMPDANYAFTVGFNNANNAFPRVFATYGETPTASALRLKTAYTSSFGSQVFEDYDRLCVAIFR